MLFPGATRVFLPPKPAASIEKDSEKLRKRVEVDKIDIQAAKVAEKSGQASQNKAEKYTEVPERPEVVELVATLTTLTSTETPQKEEKKKLEPGTLEVVKRKRDVKVCWHITY